MTEVLLGVLERGLSLWSTKESRKYLEEVMELKEAWYEEYNKEVFSDAVLDHIEQRLRIISEAFTSQVGAENSQNKS